MRASWPTNCKRPVRSGCPRRRPLITAVALLLGPRNGKNRRCIQTDELYGNQPSHQEVNGRLRRWQRGKEENVAQAVPTWLWNRTLSLWRWPSVPPPNILVSSRTAAAAALVQTDLEAGEHAVFAAKAPEVFALHARSTLMRSHII